MFSCLKSLTPLIPIYTQKMLRLHLNDYVLKSGVKMVVTTKLFSSRKYSIYLKVTLNLDSWLSILSKK